MPDVLDATRALVIDANHNARMLIVAHLRELGVGEVRAVTRPSEARMALEAGRYDIVVCDNDFGESPDLGQQLLDELRREHVLPQSTVFIMVTADASYAAVAGAAEAALDVYLLKPYTLAAFSERLFEARHRKRVLKPIFDAMAEQAFEQAAAQCLQRFERREDCWLHAARIGAELLLRLKRNTEARALYQAIIEARTVPWAKLGMARAEYASGQLQSARKTLETLVGELPDFADGWDMLGRVHMDEGRLDLALQTYQQALRLTPACLLRAQRAGTLAFYAGKRAEAQRLLEGAQSQGLRSRLFDYFSLVLLALIHHDEGDSKALRQLLDGFEQLLLQHPGSARLTRQRLLVQALLALSDGRRTEAQSLGEQLARALDQPDADLEVGCLLISLGLRLQRAGLRWPGLEALLQALALRYCVNKASTEVLVAMGEGAAELHAPVRAAHERIAELAEQAMTLSLKGKPERAVQLLAEQGERTRNAKLIDMAMSVLRRHAARIGQRAALEEFVSDLQACWVLPISGSLAKAKAGQPLATPRGPAIENTLT
ncbi:tetratricopeptide (TPR) repeat protein [Inhella inkyongensis]|uniref:Tetratricopeptide (TPR) repeat protein n=1 Tax=Inhella inkyongensis TaxID=392593 RepID=A0A840S6I7_9BURK|nr:response regulator [Inhella inkyongensis]MBB5205212.1 tetratricopeptide (TPR) repeat protein [Inhella inkyongensis]